ncbi:MAG: hypothetical protein ACHQ4G_08000 [Opitutales bacterium]
MTPAAYSLQINRPATDGPGTSHFVVRAAMISTGYSDWNLTLGSGVT